MDKKLELKIRKIIQESLSNDELDKKAIESAPINHYPQIKNEVNRQLAIKNAKEFGTFSSSHTTQEVSIIKFEKSKGNKLKFTVYYMFPSEFGGKFIDGVIGDKLEVIDNVLYLTDQPASIESNQENFVKAFIKLTGINVDLEKSIANL